MGIDLPKVTQKFDADTSAFDTGLDQMIAKTEEFITRLDAALTRIEAVKGAFDDLNRTRTMNVIVKYTEAGNVPDSVQSATRLIKDVNIPSSANVQPVTDLMNSMGDPSGINETTRALGDQAPALLNAKDHSIGLADAPSLLSRQQLEAMNSSAGLNDDLTNFIDTYV